LRRENSLRVKTDSSCPWSLVRLSLRGKGRPRVSVIYGGKLSVVRPLPRLYAGSVPALSAAKQLVFSCATLPDSWSVQQARKAPHITSLAKEPRPMRPTSRRPARASARSHSGLLDGRAGGSWAEETRSARSRRPHCLGYRARECLQHVLYICQRRVPRYVRTIKSCNTRAATSAHANASQWLSCGPVI
jgi:hypothetical protein